MANEDKKDFNAMLHDSKDMPKYQTITCLLYTSKGNAMPESTRDRPTRCYEYVFLLTKSKKYYYDWQAVAEPIEPTTAGRLKSGVGKGNKYAATVPGQNQPQKINRPRRKGAYTDEMSQNFYLFFCY